MELQDLSKQNAYLVLEDGEGEQTPSVARSSRGRRLVLALGLGIVLVGVVVGVTVWAVGRRGGSSQKHPYYQRIDESLEGEEFHSQLHALTVDHKVISYDNVWTAFHTLYVQSPNCENSNTQEAGIYSKYCWTFDKQCGIYHREGDCYNREHSWPKSWWGGFSQGKGAQTDLFHLYVSDGYVNARRGDLPLGYVKDPIYTSTDGMKVGACDEVKSHGFSGQCAEPIDEYKGDLARSYFYISTTYKGLFTCCDEQGVNGASIKDWMEQVLREWHTLDPVSDFELRKNDNIFSKFQNNRNPYIDHPEWVDKVKDF